MRQGQWATIGLNLLAAPVFAGGLGMQPGLWEMTAKMPESGAAAGFMPHAVKYRTCMQKKRLDHSWRALQKSSGTDSGYTFSNVKVASSHASWE